MVWYTCLIIILKYGWQSFISDIWGIEPGTEAASQWPEFLGLQNYHQKMENDNAISDWSWWWIWGSKAFHKLLHEDLETLLKKNPTLKTKYLNAENVINFFKIVYYKVIFWFAYFTIIVF